VISRATIVWTALAILAGLGLFRVKYEVQAREEQLVELNRAFERNREAIHILRAEWAYLTRPDRLAELNRRHLGFVSMTGQQIGRIEDVPLRDPVAPSAEPPSRPLAGGRQ
jgi:hypothetical protein